MDRDSILLRLRQSETSLREKGVVHAAVFGSRARATAHAGSDTDILIDVDPDAHLTVYDYVALKEFIADLFVGPVDVVSRAGLKAYVRDGAVADAIYAF